MLRLADFRLHAQGTFRWFNSELLPPLSRKRRERCTECHYPKARNPAFLPPNTYVGSIAGMSNGDTVEGACFGYGYLVAAETGCLVETQRWQIGRCIGIM